MKVKMRTTSAGPWGTIYAGQEGIVPDEIGNAMIAGGYATIAEKAQEAQPAEKKIEKTVAETAAIEPNETTTYPPARRRKKNAKVSES